MLHITGWGRRTGRFGKALPASVHMHNKLLKIFRTPLLSLPLFTEIFDLKGIDSTQILNSLKKKKVKKHIFYFREKLG